MTDTISTLAQKLRPHWLRDLGNGSGGIIAAGGGGMTVHTLSGSYHTGELDPSQAPWAVTDTELANHAALPDAHHAAATVVSPLAITGQQIRIANGSAQYQILVTGATPFAPAYAGLSTFAGNGLDFTGGKFIVGQGAGLTVSATTVALTTPGTLTVATANSASGSHTHAVTSSSNPGAAAAILATTGAGALTLKTLTVSDFLYVDGTIDFGTNTLYEDATYLQVAGSKPIRFGQNIGNANWTVYNAGGADFGGSVNITGNSNLYVSGTVGGAAGVLQTLNDRVGILCVPDPQFALDVAGPARAQYFIGPHAIQLKDALLIAHYDGPDPSSVVGEPNGHFGQVGTIAGGVAFRPGKFNKALQVAPAGQNDVGNSRPNPSGSTTGWHGHAYDMSGSLSPASVTAANAPFVGSKAIGVTYTYSLASVVDFTARAGAYTLTA